MQISSKFLPQIPNFVKNQYFSHDGQFFVKNEILWSLVITVRYDSVICTGKLTGKLPV